jgi:hypothetical protein
VNENQEMKLKHLEFIQNIITRMNTNSFMIKGWSVTLVSALFALAADKANLQFVFVAYIPVLMFWALDGYFLSQERQYRGLYKKVAALNDEKQIDFNLNATEFNLDEKTWCGSVFSSTLNLFHGALLSVLLLITTGLLIRLVLKLLCPHQAD